MNYSRFDFFELIRFLADIDDLTDSNMPPLQQTNSLSSTWFSFGIGTLCPWMKRVFTENISVGLDASDAPASVETLRRNFISLSCVLIDPWHLQPALRVRFIGRYKVELFGVNFRWMPEPLHMA